MYDVNYFIAKFEAIPESMYLERDYVRPGTGKCCPLGFCGAKDGMTTNAEIRALKGLFGHQHYHVQNINDGFDKRYTQPTPKQRILAALYDIKAMQTPVAAQVPKERIVYVAIPESVTEQAKELITSN